MNADQLLNLLFNAGIAISILATVASLGMGFEVRELLAPLRRYRLVATAIALNAAALPAAAWGIAEAFPIKDAHVDGLVLAAIGAGSAAGLKAAQLSGRADMALAVSLVVVLQLANIAVVPLWAGAVVGGASLSGGEIVKNLLLLVMLPLALGLFARGRYANHAREWQGSLVKVGNAALLIALIAGIAVNWDTIVGLLGDWVMVASVAIVVIALLSGRALGGRDPVTGATTTLISGMRFGSLGMIVIGTQLGGDADYLGPAITFSLVAFVLPLLVAMEIGRKTGRQSSVMDPSPA
jgi:bile acid:Na+ symporter, BASS family